MTWYQDLREPQVRDEVDYIVREFKRKKKIDIGGVLTEDLRGVVYMYAEDRLLVREPYLPRIQEALGRPPIQRVLGEGARLDIIKRVTRDIALVQIVYPSENDGKSAEGSDSTSEGSETRAESADRPSESADQPAESNDTEPEREQPALLRFLDVIDATFGPGILTLDHLLTVADNPSPCPATEPQVVYNPVPFPSRCPEGGDRVRIYVADTGIVKATVPGIPWLAGLDGTEDDDDPSVQGSTIQPYGAHGTFVGGVIRCLAPDADVVVKCVFDVAGSGLESDFVPKLYEGFAYGAEIIHITVASQTRCNFPLIAFEQWMADLSQHKGVVCVVAAGNNDSRRPCWPAAFPGLISVGALGADWRSRAWFSNYGGWVDVYAPGENLVNAFATGEYKCHVAPHDGETRTFYGMAQWSGTSFSTPIVTGLIAARMARCGENAREAAAALLAEARAQAIPDLGPVLFPGCGGDCGNECGSREGRGDCGCGCRCGGGRSGCGCGCGGCSDGGGRRHGDGYRR